jgi:hypothetical protein
MPFYPYVPAKLKIFSGQSPPLYLPNTEHIMAATETLLLAIIELYECGKPGFLVNENKK